MEDVKYEDIIVDISGQIGTIKLNRPRSLNSFGGKLLEEAVHAMRMLNEHPDTVFTVLTGEGRFFSAGADIMGGAVGPPGPFATKTETKLAYMAHFTPGIELVRSVIEHKKVLVLALNGPAVGGGAAWFLGSSDIVFAVESAYLQIPFSSLGLVPEHGSITNISQSIGVHRANDFLMFGRKMVAAEMEQWGIINRLFPQEGFHQAVQSFLEKQLEVNDGRSMMYVKQLQNAPLRTNRLVALYDALDGLTDRLADGVPMERFMKRIQELQDKPKGGGSKL